MVQVNWLDRIRFYSSKVTPKWLAGPLVVVENPLSFLWYSFPHREQERERERGSTIQSESGHDLLDPEHAKRIKDKVHVCRYMRETEKKRAMLWRQNDEGGKKRYHEAGGRMQREQKRKREERTTPSSSRVDSNARDISTNQITLELRLLSLFYLFFLYFTLIGWHSRVRRGKKILSKDSMLLSFKYQGTYQEYFILI